MEANKMLFNFYFFIAVLIVLNLAALAFYIALRVSPRLLNWFDNWLESIRNFFYKEEE
jgi:hypothetical protein